MVMNACNINSFLHFKNYYPVALHIHDLPPFQHPLRGHIVISPNFTHAHVDPSPAPSLCKPLSRSGLLKLQLQLSDSFALVL